MAYEALIGSDIGVLKATADLSAKQYTFVKGDTANNDQVVSAADEADNVLGVLQNTPAAGDAVQLRVVGITKLKLGGTVTRFDRVGPKADGTGISIGTGVGVAAGIALQSGVIGDIISMLLVPEASGYKIARGQATTGSASDTVVTGLNTVVAAVANLEDAPVLTCLSAQAVIGDQAGAPAAGSILIKTWKPTAANDATPVAASTFGKKVNWIAIGT
jgi:hypothetical protein